MNAKSSLTRILNQSAPDPEMVALGMAPPLTTPSTPASSPTPAAPLILEEKLVAKKVRVSAFFTEQEHYELRLRAAALNMKVDAYVRSRVLASST